MTAVQVQVVVVLVMIMTVVFVKVAPGASFEMEAPPEQKAFPIPASWIMCHNGNHFVS